MLKYMQIDGGHFETNKNKHDGFCLFFIVTQTKKQKDKKKKE